MNPEQINTVTNGLVNMHSFVDQHGPELLAAAIPGIGWWLMWRRNQRQHRRQVAMNDGIRHLEQYANDPETRRIYDDTHNQIGDEDQ